MISRSRAGRSFRLASRDDRADVQSPRDSARGDPAFFEGSGMFGSGDLVDGVDECAPVVALGGEHLAAGRGQSVEAAAALAGLLDPPAGDPAALLEAAEEGLERADLEPEPAAGAALDELADFVAVAGARLDEREDEELGAPFLQLAVEHARNMLHSDISYRGTQKTVNGTAAAPERLAGRPPGPLDKCS